MRSPTLYQRINRANGWVTVYEETIREVALMGCSAETMSQYQDSLFLRYRERGKVAVLYVQEILDVFEEIT